MNYKSFWVVSECPETVPFKTYIFSSDNSCQIENNNIFLGVIKTCYWPTKSVDGNPSKSYNWGLCIWVHMHIFTYWSLPFNTLCISDEHYIVILWYLLIMLLISKNFLLSLPTI